MKVKFRLAVAAMFLVTPPAMALEMMAYDGQHPNEIFRSPEMAEQLNFQLGPSYPMALERVQVAAPAKLVGDYITGTGCIPHNCTIDEVFYAISPDNTFVAILASGQLRRVIGKVESLPPQLQTAYQDWFGRMPISK